MKRRRSAMVGNPNRGFFPTDGIRAIAKPCFFTCWPWDHPRFPIDPTGFTDWTSTFEWKKIYGIEHRYAGPLFIHQMSHLWLDFRGIRDDFNRKIGIDYFENSRRATYVQRQYGIKNPLGFSHYHEYGWGLTASDGPGPDVLEVNGVRRVFYDYVARGAAFGPD